MPVLSVSECQAAVKEFKVFYKGIKFKSTENLANFPKGCYASSIDPLKHPLDPIGDVKNVYFNTAEGRLHSQARLMCHKTGKKTAITGYFDIMLYIVQNIA